MIARSCISGILVGLPLAVAGCGTPPGSGPGPGPGPDPSPEDTGSVHQAPPVDGAQIVGVDPGEVFPGRTVTVVVTGSATDWSAGATVDFGDGVVAGEGFVTGPTTLTVPITVAADAAFGPRDVQVTGTGDALTAEAALEIVPSVAFAQLEGSLAQGSILFVILENLDSVPFDMDTIHPDAWNFGFRDLEVVAPPGIHPVPDPYESTGTALGIVVFVDVNATTGPMDLEIRSGPPGSETSFRLPTIDIAPRPAVPLAHDVPANGSILSFGDSALYSFGTSERSILQFSLASTSGVGAPDIGILGPSGAWGPFDDPDVASILAWGTTTGVVSTGPVYGVVGNRDGFIAGMDFQVVGQSAIVGTDTTPETSAPNDTPLTAQAVTLPVTVTGCGIEYDAAVGHGEDWFEVSMNPEHAGRSLAVGTFGGDGFTDPRVRVWGDDGTTLLADQDTGLAVTGHEIVFTDPLPAGFYQVRGISTDDSWARQEPHPYELSLAMSDR